MKYLQIVFFVLTLTLFFQIPASAELVVDIDPQKVDKDKKETLSNVIDEEKEIKSDLIKFKNKDILHGKLLSIDPQKGILWKSSDVINDILFSPRNVKTIEFGGHASGNTGGNASVLLTNGDTLGGKLVSMDDENLVLDTQYGGKITVSRHMVQSIFPGENNPGILYSGPRDMDEWIKPGNQNDGKISIANETLSMSGYCSLGRDMKLPEMAKIEFAFEIAGNCQLQVLFYCKESVSNPLECYALYLSSGYIYLQKYGKHGRSGNLGNVQCKDLRAGKGKISLLLDKKNMKATLLVNGAVVKQWIDTQEAGDGTFVCFVNQSQGAIKIKDIEISQWNGKIPGSEVVKEDDKKDMVIFINGDQVTGGLKSIVKNEAVFKTEYAELKVPLKRIKQLQTATDNQHRARRNAGDVRFSFVNGDRLTLDLARIADGQVAGKSENFGKVSLNLNAFKGLELNIYEEDEE